MTTRALLRIAGALVWLVCGLPALLGVIKDPGCMSAWGHPTWLGAFAVFGVAFWKVSGASRGTWLIAAQTLAALTMLVFVCSGIESALLVVVAAQLGLFVKPSRALPWLLAQSAGMAVLASQHMPTLWPYWAIAVTAAEAFAFVIAAIAGREATARRELAAAQDEIARLSRDRERLRIARELHDLVGHDLVALHLNLEAARHQTCEPGTRAALDLSQEAAKALLADLRQAVGVLRSGPIDVRRQLRDTAARIAAPRVHLEVGADVDGLDDARALALLRCVQEVITNAAKHANASNLWIEVSRPSGAIVMTARDDGRGAARVVAGHGLTGMRERLGGLGGELHVRSAAGEGFSVRATLPLGEGQ